MTPDLQRLREKFGELGELVDAIELELVDDPAWPEPSDTSYLRPQERANPDIAANVEAMAATNALIAWFGRDMQGFVGLWRGPQNTPLEQAPVVRLDTEGQYAVVAATVPDYLLITADHDAFADHRELLRAAGFTAAASREDVWDAIPSGDGPSDYRHALYNEGRVRRGLAPVG